MNIHATVEKSRFLSMGRIAGSIYCTALVLQYIANTGHITDLQICII
jgi:hypothetical protein